MDYSDLKRITLNIEGPDGLEIIELADDILKTVEDSSQGIAFAFDGPDGRTARVVPTHRIYDIFLVENSEDDSL